MMRRGNAQVAVEQTARRGVQVAAWMRSIAGASGYLAPEYLIVGAQRAGTTSLYNYLLEHPCVGRSLLKEVHFFDDAYHRGFDWYRAHFPSLSYARRVELATGRRPMAGEASPYYLVHPHTPRRVASTLPDVKLIVMLRDPVERARSHHRHEVAKGFEALPFGEAVDVEPIRLAGERARMEADEHYRSFAFRHYSYLARGRYVEQLRAWRRWFPADRMLVLASEEFFRDPAGQYVRVLDFLGLPPVTLSSYPRHNSYPREAIPSEVRRRLTDHFRPLNEELYGYLDRDMGWSR